VIAIVSSCSSLARGLAVAQVRVGLNDEPGPWRDGGADGIAMYSTCDVPSLFENALYGRCFAPWGYRRHGVDPPNQFRHVYRGMAHQSADELDTPGWYTTTTTTTKRASKRRRRRERRRRILRCFFLSFTAVRRGFPRPSSMLPPRGRRGFRCVHVCFPHLLAVRCCRCLLCRYSVATRSQWPGGGFAKDLPNRQDLAAADLATLRDNTWVDVQTRAVLVEWLVLNANTNLVATVRLVAQFSAEGEVTSEVDVQASALCVGFFLIRGEGAC